MKSLIPLVLNNTDFLNFIVGCIGAFAPEAYRLYNLRTEPALKWSSHYLLFSIPFVIVGGFVAWTLDPQTKWAAFYGGLTAPILITTAMKDTAKAEKELMSVENDIRELRKTFYKTEEDNYLLRNNISSLSQIVSQLDAEDDTESIAKIKEKLAEFEHSKQEHLPEQYTPEASSTKAHGDGRPREKGSQEHDYPTTEHKLKKAGRPRNTSDAGTPIRAELKKAGHPRNTSHGGTPFWWKKNKDGRPGNTSHAGAPPIRAEQKKPGRPRKTSNAGYPLSNALNLKKIVEGINSKSFQNFLRGI